MGLTSKFFKIKPEYLIDGKAIITSTTIDLALDTLATHVFPVTFDDGDILVHCHLKDHNLNAMEENTEAEAESMAGVLELGLQDVYVGMDYSETPYVGLFWFLPELKGTRTETDEDGNEYEVAILPRHRWGAE